MIQVTGGPVTSVSEGWSVPYVRHKLPWSQELARADYMRHFDEKAQRYGRHPLLPMTYSWRRVVP